ncbi:P-loop containing nucleoside triphosphate hydrolase protein [Penicillium waksmanii]|uniref:P-loop containing nucleoside triphosphate hydrolase protein n=1 Tax=Penicillium waksmanii TaxID=69791 RepID=UPI00254956EE|nr:P-loop containing nucleoside triphosphate hydrolase protein [Penicillium waksmanii]KAJ5975515.1 P-loop containing nucleoside triphosphate hydrolase protein [Penicillium waksmanii]
MPDSSQDQALKGLQSSNAKILFDKIDELRTIGVGGLVELPQLIVCGKQSSGKSSVLEAISRVRFPTKTKLCTRFATEVILRRSPEPRFKVSIDPGESRSDEDRERLQKFCLEVFPKGDDDTPFKDLVERAQEWMGIDSAVESSTGFSDDVLKVEISGPEKPELTLVDLPGLYEAKSKEQTTEGIQFVQKITEKYMRNERSIILAVLSAKFNYVHQDILDRAEQVDPEFKRVLGIVTAPDLMASGSEEEDEWLEYIRNEKEPKLKLGWHVLRNRAYAERNIDDNERDREEKEFFETGKWPSISRAHVGIESLRRRLSDVLFDQVRRNFPGLVRDIQGKIASHKHNLSNLGAPRSTIQEQRSFLVDISTKFSNIVTQGLTGFYNHDFFKELEDDAPIHDNRRRLRAVICQLNEYFVDVITIRGCGRTIIYVNSVEPHFTNLGKPGFKQYMDCWIPKNVQLKVLIEETKKSLVLQRGSEMPGEPNSLVVRELYRQQSSPWENIARMHIETAHDAVTKFVCSVLKYLTDRNTFSAIYKDIIAPELEKLNFSVLEKLEELTSHSKYGHPLPVRREYLARIMNEQRLRQLHVLKQKLVENGTEQPGLFSFDQIDTAAHTTTHGDEDIPAMKIIDQVETYYNISITTFIDNVAILAIENCLLLPLERIFTSLAVSNMDTKQIRSLADEPAHVQSDRERYTSQLEKLEAGLKTLNILNREESSLATPIVFGK